MTYDQQDSHESTYSLAQLQSMKTLNSSLSWGASYDVPLLLLTRFSVDIMDSSTRKVT